MFLAKLEKVLFFLTILFLPTQLGKHFWPDFSYIYSLKIDYLSPALYFWDILVVGLLMVWIFRKPVVNKTALSLLLFFLLTQVLSLLSANNIGAGLVRLEQYLVAGFFGIYLASQDFKDLLKKIYLPLTLGIIGETVISILQFIKGGTLGFWILGERTFTISTPGIAKFDFHGLEFLRPYGTFPHPNVLAGFMLVGICIMYYVLRERRVAAKLALVLGSVAIFLTMSRVAILAGVMILLLNIKRKRFIWIVLILFAISPILFTRFYSLLNFDSLTLLRREELVGSSFQIFLRSPIFGVGLNNFIPITASDLAIGPSRFLQPVHNILLLTLSETGIIGLVGFLLLVGIPIKFIVYSLSFMGKTKSTITIYHKPSTILLLWFIILFLGMFDHYFLTLPQGYRLLFLVWGLSFPPRLNRGSVLK